jgi:hypothetical protein
MLSGGAMNPQSGQRVYGWPVMDGSPLLTEEFKLADAGRGQRVA